MSIHDKFIDSILSHPEYKKIREELGANEESDGLGTPVDLGNGVIAYTGGYESEEQSRNYEIMCEISWYISNGPGYCKDAPPHIRKYLKRLGI